MHEGWKLSEPITTRMYKRRWMIGHGFEFAVVLHWQPPTFSLLVKILARSNRVCGFPAPSYTGKTPRYFMATHMRRVLL